MIGVPVMHTSENLEALRPDWREDVSNDAMRGPLYEARILLGAAYLGAGLGGISRVARLTARALVDYGCDLEAIALHDKAAERLGGVSTARTARGSKAAFAAACHFASLRPAHFIYDQAGLARGHAGLGRWRRPFAVWMHGIEIWEALKPEARAVLARADARFINSNYSLDRYRRLHGDTAPVGVCWLATEDEDPPAVMPRFEGPPTALLMARIDELAGFKGHAEILDVWPRVVSTVPGARLVFAGGGAGLARLKEAVARSPAASSIEVTGFVPESDLPALWRRAHVLAMPSRKEGFGLVYIEAMRYGLPAIASVHDAGQEVNLDGLTGLNVDMNGPDDIADALIALLRDTDRAAAMGRAGHARWRQHFRYSAFRSRFRPLVEDFVCATS